MNHKSRWANLIAAVFCSGILASQPAAGQDIPIALQNWVAPLYWRAAPEPSDSKAVERAANLSGPLPFIGVTPCRAVDTRGASGQTGAFGPPIMAANSTRTFPIPTSPCGIPATARAYSLNITVIPSGILGFLAIWPTGSARPTVSTLNSFDGSIVANAAIVPAGTSGSVDVFVENAATHVIIDVNGYYDDSASGRGGLANLVTTAQAGGTGGSPYTRACPGGAVATGIQVKQGTFEQPVVGDIAVVCTSAVFGAFGGAALSGAPAATSFVTGGTGALAALSCPANAVMTGIQGSTKPAFGGAAVLVENLSIQCTPISPGGVTVVGPSGAGNTTPFALPCPGRMVVTGLGGQAGQLMDAIHVRCQ